MTTSAFSLPRVIDVSDLGELDDPIATDNGQSRSIQPLRGHPGFLVKTYVAPLGMEGAERLDRLIALPAVAGERDQRTISAHTSWPVARVDAGSQRAVGCILPRAPEKFKAALQLAPGRMEERYLDVDWLARPTEKLLRRGLTVPDTAARLRVCREILEVAALLARHNLVYSDWSYSNAFFSQADWSAFVIDIDGCAYRLGPNIFQPNWDDPLTPRSTPADTYTDRYRAALLIGRCLTGENHPARMLHALKRDESVTLNTALLDVLCSKDRKMRPPPSALLAILDGLPYLRMPVQREPLPPAPPPPPVHVPPQHEEPPPPEPVPLPRVPSRAAVALAVSAAITAVLVLIVVLLNQ